MTLDLTDKLMLSALLPTASNQQQLRDLLQKKSREIDWSIVVRRSLEIGTAALLRFNLALVGGLPAISVSEQQRLEQESHSWAARQILYVNETRRLMELLRNAGIQSLPLKGAALMLGDFYPKPGLRAVVDIDLLIDPRQAEAAFTLVGRAGYSEVAVPMGKSPLRIPYEMRHLPLLRGENGILLELHYRAFHNLQNNRDFGMAEMRERAVRCDQYWLPAPEDLALHLIQHSMVDLTSANSILRTLADLHFIFVADLEAPRKLLMRAEENDLGAAAELALKAVQKVEKGEFELSDPQVRLLIEIAISRSMPEVLTAARLAEYLDLRQQPLQKIKHLASLVKATGRSEKKSFSTKRENLFKRAYYLFRRFDWSGIKQNDLRRVLKLRKIMRKK